MGNGNIDVGKKIPVRKSGQPKVKTLVVSNGPSAPRIDKQNFPKADRPKICGAMAQQSSDSGRINESAPQKLVHLVGCRDRNARPEPWIRLRPASLKQ